MIKQTKQWVYILISFLSLFLFNHLGYAAPQPISSPSATFDDAQFYFSYKASTRQDFYRVYIDNTRDPSTGFSVGNIGAKYLLENTMLYRYVGPGWNWEIVKNVPYNANNNRPRWTIGRNDSGNNTCAGTIDYVFQTQVGSKITTGSKATLTFTKSTTCSEPTPTPPPPPPPTTTSQKIAVPAYIWPDCATNPNCDWNRLNTSMPQVGIAVINPGNGPGNYSQPAYVSVVKNFQSAGGSILGYVYTSYGARSVSDLSNEINNYYNWYGVDGIFFDEGYGSDCLKLTYYQQLNSLVKAKGGKAITVVNYGTNPSECYINASDILLTFEDVYNNYVNWQPASWQAKYPANRFWHLVHTTSQDQLLNAISQSVIKRAGWVYVTPLGMPNPWYALPNATYWSMELNAIK